MPKLSFNVSVEPECIIYLDSIKKIESGIYEMFIDFRQIKDWRTFNSYFGSFGSEKSKGTYIRLINVKSRKRLRRDCYYKLNLSAIKKYMEFHLINDSYIFFVVIDLSQMKFPKMEMDEILQRHSSLEKTDIVHKYNYKGIDSLLPQLLDSNLAIKVRDVGQANWNELRKNDIIKIIFDLGAPIASSISNIESYVSEYLPKLMSDRPLLILSHWDIDHIHCLKYFEDINLSKYFRGVICSGIIKSLTAKKMFESIKRDFNGRNIFCIPPAPRTTGIAMHICGERGILKLYVGEKSSSLNFSGLCLYVCSKTSVVFTGDLRLSQVNDIHSKEIKEICVSNHILIAPHHGGDYGNKHRRYSLPCNIGLVSVGENHYNHPNPNMIQYLKKLTANNVFRTINCGDIVMPLG